MGSSARDVTTLARISRVVIRNLGRLAAQLSRLAAAVTSLQSAFTSAASKITDVNMAEESAELVRSQILQQAQTALLAQANQATRVVLALLGP
jgi:flagellin